MKRYCSLKAGQPSEKRSKARELEEAATCESSSTKVLDDIRTERIKECTESQASTYCPSIKITCNNESLERIVGNSITNRGTSDLPGRVTRASTTSMNKASVNLSVKHKSSSFVKQKERDLDISSDDETTSDEDSDNWQEVEDKLHVSHNTDQAATSMQQAIGEKTVEIDIGIPGNSKGRGSTSTCRTGNFGWAKYLQWQINRSNKAFQEKIHKAHLVCLLASALHANKICNSKELQARALSQVPSKLLFKKSTKVYNNLNWITQIIKWLCASFKLDAQDHRNASPLHAGSLSVAIQGMSASGESVMIYICLIILRALGLQARLIQSFQPIPIKYTMLSKVGNGSTTKTETRKRAKLSSKIKSTSNTRIYKCSTQGQGILSKINKNISKTGELYKTDQLKAKKRVGNGSSVQHEGYKNAVSTGVISDSNCMEYCDQTSRQAENASNRHILSSDSEEDSPSHSAHLEATGTCRDSWIEVYNSSENKWISVDCIGGNINRPDLCEQNATKPICYVLAVDNDNCLKDVTKRYASKWMFETKKLRAQSTWWENTLKPYSTKHVQRDDMEDAQFNDQLQERPLPTSILEYKNHNLYVLKRHLLKFEALFPESPAVLGYCKGEAVYSRDCVHTLHSRETWLKQGLAIKSDEQPYKTVKSRPKKNKTITPHLSLYGKWQTEMYIPPPAVDGKVPRNKYGNVELFQPSMLPMGTVYLQIPGLNQTARKLNIDCASAMVGWDYHGGFCHPVLDGYVVCEEFQEVLLDAWEKDMAEKEKKLKQKMELRAVKNWKSLVNGVLIRERLTARFQESDSNITLQGYPKCWPENKLSSTK